MFVGAVRSRARRCRRGTTTARSGGCDPRHRRSPCHRHPDSEGQPGALRVSRACCGRPQEDQPTKANESIRPAGSPSSNLAIPAWIELCQGRENLLQPTPRRSPSFVRAALISCNLIAFSSNGMLLIVQQRCTVPPSSLGKNLGSLRNHFRSLTKLKIQLGALERRAW